MIYVANDKALYTDKGEFIKHIDCPLASKLAQAVSAAHAQREFHCPDCKNRVKNLRYLSDAEALSMASKDPNVCFFATEQANNVVHLNSTLPLGGFKYSNFQKLPVVRTARGLAEINFAVANGYKVALRKTSPTGGPRYDVALIYEERSNRYACRYDHRTFTEPDDEFNAELMPKWETVIDFFSHPVPGAPEPVAAYVIEPDLPPDTDVYLEDLIEDLLDELNQGAVERLQGWYGHWDGREIKIYEHPAFTVFG